MDDALYSCSPGVPSSRGADRFTAVAARLAPVRTAGLAVVLIGR
jgi:hypothetical protein